MKIYKVSFNDGGWQTRMPEETVVAESKGDAIRKALDRNPQYKNGYSIWATEFEIEGYIIEVYDEKTYNREKNLEKLDI